MFVPLHESVPVVEPSSAGGVFSLLWVIIALPALGAAVILLLGNTRTSKWAHLLGCATVVVSFLISLVAFSHKNGALDGQIAAFFVMVVAAAEVVVGLAIIMTIFRTRRSASVDDASLLKY